PCIGKFGADGDGRFEPVHLGHLQVHQRYIGPMGPELPDGLAAIPAFSDELHVRLAGQERRDAVAEQRVIVHGQDPDGWRIAHTAAGFAYATDAGMVSSASVPESTSLQSESVPPISFARSCMPAIP